MHDYLSGGKVALIYYGSVALTFTVRQVYPKILIKLRQMMHLCDVRNDVPYFTCTQLVAFTCNQGRWIVCE